MKKTPLKRKTQLKSKTSIGNRKPICRVSDKQKVELARRRKLKAEKLQDSDGLCQHCGKPPDWRGLALHHKVRLSQGGKTQFDNLELLCGQCHSEAHNIKELTNT